MEVEPLCRNLLGEREALLEMLAPLDPGAWRTPTPAPGWTILDQVAHLAAGDDQARRALTDPEGFTTLRDEVMARPERPVAQAVGEQDAPAGVEAEAWLRRSGAAFAEAARAADPARRIPWFGPDMSLASAVTARIMETWAHGRDVADALGVSPVPSPSLRHVADLGWRTIGFSFVANGRPAPTVPVRVELDGGFARGPSDAADVVRGPLLDFCLVVTRRRHPADTALVAEGPVAAEWLSIAQCYAGPPGPGPGREADGRAHVPESRRT